MRLHWLWISASDLETELEQLADEGALVPPALEQRLRRLAARGDDYLADPRVQEEAGELLDRTAALGVRDDYPYQEPSDLEGIHALRGPAPPLPEPDRDQARLGDRLHGAWLGRAYGCYLGKPVEGLRRQPGETFILEGLLQASGQWPLQGYYTLDLPPDTLVAHGVDARKAQSWGAGPEYMPEDDDTNYTAVGLAVMARHGSGFTPREVAAFWLDNIPVGHVCTAERVAYRNFCLNLAPPESAYYRNPYREWIGAQIRADFFGYAAPGRPERAAEYAWRDACISHIKNGIYGEMWAAAMLAAAYVTEDVEMVIRAGLAQIPEHSRLHAAVGEVLAWRAAGKSYQEAIVALHARWDEHNAHHWCHTISNAQICAVALLWGEGDYATAISRAVLPGLDTDCNGATVGSIVGMMLGAARLPAKLVGRLQDRIRTGVQGYLDCSISAMAEQMAQVVQSLE